MKRRRRSYIRTARHEAQAFLLWLLERPRAFVVFNKADLRALRKA